MRYLGLLLTQALFGVTVATAQTVYVASDRTVAGGNPLNGNTGSLFIGQTAAGAQVSGVDAEVVAPAQVLGWIYGVSDSRTTLLGGNDLLPINGGGYSGIFLSQTAQLRVAGNVRLGTAVVGDNASLVVDQGWLEGLQINGAGRATVNDGRFQSNGITALDALGADAVLTVNGGLSTGALRAFGGTVQLNGGDYAILHALSDFEISSLRPTGARLAALNRSNSQGHFTLFGTGFALSNPTAGSYVDGYLNSFPGVSFTLTGTMGDGQAINASYFEEGLTLGQAPRLISFVAPPVPEPATWAQLLVGLALLGGVGGTAGRRLGTAGR